MRKSPLIVFSWISKSILVQKIENTDCQSIDGLVKPLLLLNGDVVLKELIPFENIPSVAYVIAKLYAGEKIGQNLQPYISINAEQRELKAIHYAKKAMALNYDEARCFLVTAYMTGAYGCISSSTHGLDEIYQLIKSANNIPALFDFACYKLSRFPLYPHDKLSNDILIRPSNNTDEALIDFAQVLKGDDPIFILKTIDILYIHFGAHKTIHFLKEQCNKHHSSWLGLFLACLHSPPGIIKDNLPLELDLNALKEKVTLNIDNALSYLVISEGELQDNVNQLAIQFKQALEEFKIHSREQISSSSPKPF